MLQVDLNNILPEEDALQRITDIFQHVEDKKEVYVVTKGGRPVLAIVDIDHLEKDMDGMTLEGTLDASQVAAPSIPVTPVVPVATVAVPEILPAPALPVEMPPMPSMPEIPDAPLPGIEDLPPMPDMEPVPTSSSPIPFAAAPFAPAPLTPIQPFAALAQMPVPPAPTTPAPAPAAPTFNPLSSPLTEDLNDPANGSPLA